MILKILRNTAGQIIIFINYVTRPKQLQRSDEAQRAIDDLTRNMALYQFRACPFCVRARRTIYRLNLNIETRDAMNNIEHREQLLTQGGKVKVPCLRIEENNQVLWMYESLDIIEYLTQRFDNTVTETA